MRSAPSRLQVSLAAATFVLLGCKEPAHLGVPTPVEVDACLFPERERWGDKDYSGFVWDEPPGIGTPAAYEELVGKRAPVFSRGGDRAPYLELEGRRLWATTWLSFDPPEQPFCVLESGVKAAEPRSE